MTELRQTENDTIIIQYIIVQVQIHVHEQNIYKTTFIPVLDIQELAPVVQLVDENTLFVKLPLI